MNNGEAFFRLPLFFGCRRPTPGVLHLFEHLILFQIQFDATKCRTATMKSTTLRPRIAAQIPGKHNSDTRPHLDQCFQNRRGTAARKIGKNPLVLSASSRIIIGAENH